MLVRGFMAGDVPIIPNVKFGLVDVRDVAEGHIRAMQLKSEGGEFVAHRRFILNATGIWF